MANRSKAKGDRLENLVCTYLSFWASEDPTAKLFIKAPDSGAIATKERDKITFFDDILNRPGLKEKLLEDLRERSDFAVADIYPVHPDVYTFSRLFAVECKNYEFIDWARLLFQPYARSDQSTVYKHWQHLIGLCNDYKRVPFLIYNETRIAPVKGATKKHPIILIPDDFIYLFRSWRELSYYKVAHFPQIGIEVFRLHDFLRVMNYDELVDELLVSGYLEKKEFTLFPILGKKKPVGRGSNNSSRLLGI